MNIQRAAPFQELLARLLFLILPTAFMGYFLLLQTRDYFAGLQFSVPGLSLYFALGMTASVLFHAIRFRFLLPFLALILGSYLFYQGIDNLASGEFDAPLLEVRFLSFSVLFITGWIFGWGFLRLRYWSVAVAALLLCAGILLAAKSSTASVQALLWSFSPLALFAVYLLFAAGQIYRFKDRSRNFWWFLTGRLFLFSLLVVGVFDLVAYTMRKELRATVAEYGGGGKPGENSLLKANKDGTFDLADYTQLRSSLGRSNELLFCARIDNFFKGTDLPNPLYLNAFYYTRFDTLTETFERDSLLPANDLFEPDPSKLSLFATRTDSSVLRNSGTEKLGKTVEVEIYSRRLSPGTYLAPHTGYFVQPITVEKEFRDSFRYAFRTKSWVSELNSAYFVYNAPDPQIRAFQEMRFSLLRKVTDFSHVDPRFMAYYTQMPGDSKFKEISALAQQLTQGAQTPVDKIIALRDWFLSKDPTGKPLFQYSDNPGIPDIPNASKLHYFLFENRKGYCSYYAGATLFLLRSLGIPSRIAAGFLTQDRSDKNKGWYWYYADQAHAWVQVYFPGYGWLDFDTTVGNSDARESPKPDGTPPMQPPRAQLVADGLITEVDTLRKIVRLQVSHFLYQDQEYRINPAYPASLDVQIAAIRRDSVEVPLGSIRTGEAATAVSYAEAFKKLPVRKGENANTLMKRFPAAWPMDEVYLKRLETRARRELPRQLPADTTFPLRRILEISGLAMAGLLVCCFLLPILLFSYFKGRAQSAGAAGAKAYWSYRAASFYLHQLGYYRGLLSPLQYARDLVDPSLGTRFTGFMQLYLKQKYAQQPLSEPEQAMVALFLPAFLLTVRKKIPAGRRLSAFLRPLRSLRFFYRPLDADEVS